MDAGYCLVVIPVSSENGWCSVKWVVGGSAEDTQLWRCEARLVGKEEWWRGKRRMQDDQGDEVDLGK
ncbi:hypothetical protein M0R45_000456 [Rubus argutus]|uniref:MHC class I antigen n=1 Tax=Rubus argutus TaxID=59490 RepID=A0AAW1VP98_RUBAR